ncbi:precorrin-6A reductase [Desulforamulus ruminis]|uniref:Precorrin-6x reductase n=1 Tax=Desulforamulus ruminis (strain ATCC 23193 / DSM 2154 / NCIMB 8452 / DL) TaxID=696281 RepID=F6DJW7_DESRL|nr:precorrin-6A reductase [Desulforamulus ruminis]AEG59181.1 precorrin-6x reductase [Desulforamulus ruminis DSM 2154]
MILVLAGTLEGRNTAALLQERGFRVAASVVSPYGARLLEKKGVHEVYTGTLDRDDLKEVLNRGCRLLVDATHPYATLASETAMEAASETGIPYLRLERPAASLPVHPLVHREDSLQSSIDKALALGPVLFSTLGSKNLPPLLAAARQAGVRVVARILPDAAMVARCQEWGLTPADMVALQGPCSKELNKALFRQYEARVILTKESGATGGVTEKVEAALELGLPVVIWQRPRLYYPLTVDSPERVLEYCLTRLREEG